MFNKILEREELSKDFLERNYEYRAELEKARTKLLQEYNEQYCPFTPKISESSKEYAQKYH